MEICETFTRNVLTAQETWILTVCGVSTNLIEKLLLTKQPLMDITTIENFPNVRTALLNNDAHLSVIREAYNSREWRFRGNPVIYEENMPYVLQNRSMIIILEALAREESNASQSGESKYELFNRSCNPSTLISYSGETFKVYESENEYFVF
jgi:hypothetical protein